MDRMANENISFGLSAIMIAADTTGRPETANEVVGSGEKRWTSLHATRMIEMTLTVHSAA